MVAPVTLEIAKARLGIVSDHRDDELQELVDAAIAHIEADAMHYLESRNIVEPLDRLSSAVELMAWPVTAIVSIDYLDSDGAEQSVAGARLLSKRRPAFLMPAVGEAWPGDVALDLSATITVGHAGDAADPYPPQLIQAILLLVGHWFDNHEAVVIGSSVNELPIGVNAICHQFRSHLI